MKLTEKKVKNFLSNYYNEEIHEIDPVSTGEWSSAFFYTHANQNLVIRFAKNKEFFEKDRYASQFRSFKLPMPEIIDIGESKWGYFCISERKDGEFIETISKSDFEKTIPNLFETISNLRQIDLSDTKGYGGFGADGNGEFDSLGEALIMSANKDGEWKDKLKKSELGYATFEKSLYALEANIVNCPDERHLVHSDMLYYNLLVKDNKISGIIDWGSAIIGDFLYDIAWFQFWKDWYDNMCDYDFYDLAREYFRSRDEWIIDLEKRMFTYEIYIGLDNIVYSAGKDRWEMVEKVYKKLDNLIEGD